MFIKTASRLQDRSHLLEEPEANSPHITSSDTFSTGTKTRENRKKYDRIKRRISNETSECQDEATCPGATKTTASNAVTATRRGIDLSQKSS